MSSKHPFDTYITPYALQKLNEMAAAALPTEIGGLAKIEELGDNVVVVTDIVILEQETTAATFSITGEMVTAWMQGMMAAGRIDEIPLFKSIVHSHPVGMSAFMSGVDVDNIKSYAGEQEAFSLILGASHKADTSVGDRLLMHYCCTVGSRKMIFRDMPVQIATTHDRISLGDSVAALVRERYGSAVSDEDMKAIESASQEFATNLLPGLWKSEISALKEEAKSTCKEVIKSRPTGGHRSGAGVGCMPPDSQRSWERDDWLSGGSGSQYGYGRALTHNTQKPKTVRKEDLSLYERLRIEASGYDPDSGANISKKRRKKASQKLREMEVEMASIAREADEAALEYLVLTEIREGDYVTLRPDKLGVNLSQCASEVDTADLHALTEKPDKVERVDGDGVHVSGFLFDESELLVFDIIDGDVSEAI